MCSPSEGNDAEIQRRKMILMKKKKNCCSHKDRMTFLFHSWKWQNVE